VSDVRQAYAGLDVSDRVVTSLPATLAGFLRSEATRIGTTFDQVVGAAYRAQADRLRAGWRPEGTAAAAAIDDPFFRPVRIRRGSDGAVQVTFRGLSPDALKALDELAVTVGCVREGDRPNRSAVIALLLAATKRARPPSL
jgi:hypothetical protein